MPNLISIEELEADKAFVQQQLEKLPPSPWGTARLMWEQRLADLDNKLQAVRECVKSTASVALSFEGLPVNGHSNIRLDFATEALSSYQKIVTASAALLRDREIANKGRMKRSGESKLYIKEIKRGSVGFLLEEKSVNQREMFNSHLKSAVEYATEFVETMKTSNEDEFALLMGSAVPRFISEIQKFVLTLRDAGATAKIVGSERKTSLDLNDVHRVSERLSEYEIVEERETYSGILLGILPDSHTFELKINEHDETIKGSLSDELVEQYISNPVFKETFLLRSVKAIIRYTRTKRLTKQLREQIFLEGLEHHI